MTHSDIEAVSGLVSGTDERQNRPETRRKSQTSREPETEAARRDSDTMIEIVLTSRDDIPGVPADAWPVSEIWCPIPGYSAYQASNWGDIRSVDRLVGNRQLKGALLKSTLSPARPGRPAAGRYPRLKVTNDQGEPKTKEVHALQMLAFEGECPAGLQVRHLDDNGEHNYWAPGGEGNGTNLVYGTPREQWEDKCGNRGLPVPPPPPPPRYCEPHGNPVTKGSKTRCHDCVVQMGQAGARLLAAGLTPEAAAGQLGYPAPDGLVKLAARYGGWTPGLPGPQEPAGTLAIGSRRRRPLARRLRGWLRAVTRRNGDAQ